MANPDKSTLPEAMVIFVNGKFFHAGPCNQQRPDVAEYFKNPALKESRFQYMFPKRRLKNIERAEIRIFTVSANGLASEVKYPKDYRWR